MANFQNIVGYQLAQAASTTAGATIYTVPSTPPTLTFVKNMMICNTTGSPITFNLHLVPFGGTAGTGNAVYYGTSVAANATLEWTGTMIMNSGGTIYFKASATGLTITISGGQGT